MAHRDHLRKGEKVEVWKSLIAGSLAGLTARFGTAPMDTIKIRLQIMPKHEHQPFGVLNMTQDIVKKEGLRGLWKGNIPGSYLYIIFGGVQFSTYSFFNNILSPTIKSPELNSFVVGALAGAVSSAASYPFDILRTRFVADRNVELSSISRTVREVWHENGLSGFFKGCTSSITAITLNTSIMFCVYESIKIFCERRKSDFPSLYISTLDHSASTIGGVVSKFATFPLDTARRRMVIGHSSLANHLTANIDMYTSYRKMSLLHIISTMMRQEGIHALYKGVTMALFKSVPSTAITLYSYELFIKYLSG